MRIPRLLASQLLNAWATDSTSPRWRLELLADVCDKGYTGQTVAQAADLAAVGMDIGSGPKPANGFQVQPRR